MELAHLSNKSLSNLVAAARTIVEQGVKECSDFPGRSDYISISLEEFRALASALAALDKSQSTNESFAPGAYEVKVCRTGYGFATITVEVDSGESPEKNALAITGDFSYHEKNADYEVIGYRLQGAN